MKPVLYPQHCNNIMLSRNKKMLKPANFRLFFSNLKLSVKNMNFSKAEKRLILNLHTGRHN